MRAHICLSEFYRLPKFKYLCVCVCVDSRYMCAHVYVCTCMYVRACVYVYMMNECMYVLRDQDAEVAPAARKQGDMAAASPSRSSTHALSPAPKVCLRCCAYHASCVNRAEVFDLKLDL